MKEALVLLAHADDESLGVGGTIPLLVADGWNVQVVLVTDGVVALRSEPSDNRADAGRACEVLGVPAPVFLGFPCNRLDTCSVAEMAAAVSGLSYNPDLIITHAAADLSCDHRIVAEIARIVGRPRRKPIGLLECEVPSYASWNGSTFLPNYYVDITQQIETKIRALSEYSNELREYPDPWSPDGLRVLAQYHGMQSGYRYAEAFRLVRGGSGLLP